MIKFLKDYWILIAIVYIACAAVIFTGGADWWEYILLFPLTLLIITIILKDEPKPNL